MECAAQAMYCTLQLWLGAGWRLTDLARGNGETQMSIDARISEAKQAIHRLEEVRRDRGVVRRIDGYGWCRRRPQMASNDSSGKRGSRCTA